MLTYMGVPVLPDGLDNSDNADALFYRFSLALVGLAEGTESPQDCSVKQLQSSLRRVNCAFTPRFFSCFHSKVSPQNRVQTGTDSVLLIKIKVPEGS